MKCRSAVRSSQGAIYERPPVQGSLAAINIAILRQLTSSTCSRLINGLFSRCRPDETRQDKSSLGGNKSFIYVKFCNICGGPNELPASLSPSLPHCGRVSTLSDITISRPISLSLLPHKLQYRSTFINKCCRNRNRSQSCNCNCNWSCSCSSKFAQFSVFSAFGFQFSASVFTVLTMCRYLPLAGRFHVPFARSLLLLLLELSTHSQTTWITLSATKMQQLKANELRTANSKNWWHIKHFAKFNELSEFPSPAGDESRLSSVRISFVFNQCKK